MGGRGEETLGECYLSTKKNKNHGTMEALRHHIVCKYTGGSSNTGITVFVSRTKSISVDVAFWTDCENAEDPLDIQPEILFVRMGHIQGLLLVGNFVEQGGKTLVLGTTPLLSVFAVDVKA